MPTMDKLSTYRTTIAARGDDIAVTYVSTDIVRFNASRVVLNSGGYETVTTKRKMNQAARQFGLGYSVFQKAHVWYVAHKGQTLPFVDGMELARG